MQIQSVQGISSRQELTGPREALSSYSPGDVLQAEVVEADQGQVVLRLPEGELVKASQRTMEPLQAGDIVLLQISQQEEGQSAPTLELVSVNGQPLKTAAPLAEFALLRIQVPPSRANLAIAEALSQMGAPARPETFARMAELTARFPDLSAGESLLFAASSLPLDADTVAAFANWLQDPVQTADFAAAAESLAARNGQAAPLLEAAVRQMEAVVAQARGVAAPQAVPGELPQGLSPSLSAKLTQSGVWQELSERLPALPEPEARGLMLQLMADLPPEASGAERALVYQAMQGLRPQASMDATQSVQSQPKAPQTAQDSHTTAAGAQAPADTAQSVQSQPEAPQTAQDSRAAAAGPQSPPERQANPLPQGAKPQETVQTGQAPKEQSILQSGLRDLFAALLERAPGEQGQALREAAAELETKLLAFTGALKAQEGPETARLLKPVLEMGQALTAQVQMGGELGNLLYVPLPITLHENRQDAGLYVLKRHGGSSMVDEANVTVAICLETQNLGPVDTLLKVERGDITLQFRVEGAKAHAFIQSQLSQAAELPFPAPYRFKSASVVRREAAITPLNAGQALQQAFGLSAPGALDISI